MFKCVIRYISTTTIIHVESKPNESISSIVSKIPITVERISPKSKPPIYQYKDGYQYVTPYKKLMYNNVSLKGIPQQLTVLQYLNKIFIGRNETFFKDQILNNELWIYRPRKRFKKIEGKDFSKHQKIKGTTLLTTKIKTNDIIANFACIHELKVPIFDLNDKENDNLIFEDNNLLVINKPVGIPIHPSGMAYNYNSIEYMITKNYLQTDKIWIIHRLDKDTSGVLILAKNSETCSKFNKFIENRNGLTKQYLALVEGNFGDQIRIETNPIIEIDLSKPFNKGVGKEFNAKTVFKNVYYDSVSNTSLISCFLQNGRKHQIRQHLKNLGYPIINDPLYGKDKILSMPIYSPPNREEFQRLRELYENQLNERVDNWEMESVCTNCSHVTYNNQLNVEDNYMRLFSFHYSYKDEYDGSNNWSFTAPIPPWAKSILPEGKADSLMKDHQVPMKE